IWGGAKTCLFDRLKSARSVRPIGTPRPGVRQRNDWFDRSEDRPTFAAGRATRLECEIGRARSYRAREINSDQVRTADLAAAGGFVVQDQAHFRPSALANS